MLNLPVSIWSKFHSMGVKMSNESFKSSFYGWLLDLKEQYFQKKFFIDGRLIYFAVHRFCKKLFNTLTLFDNAQIGLMM